MFVNYKKSAANLSQRFACLLLVILMVAISVHAGDKKKTGFQDDFFKVYNFTSDKAAQLANAIPEDKYDWRPAEGVRSVRESILHIAGANYYMASLLGTPVPEGVDPRALEKSQDSKEKILSTLKESVTHMQVAIKNLKAEDFDTEIEFFGMKGTKRQVVFIAGDHAAEHLGQLIAYARSNSVVPPWSMKEK